VEQGDVRVLVVSGRGRGFCAGQDLSERQRREGEGPVDLGETVETFYAPLIRRLNALPMPVVVGVNGVAAGAGANLALAGGDIVVAAESASFIQPFCRLGLIPDTGGTYALPRLRSEERRVGKEGRPRRSPRDCQRDGRQREDAPVSLPEAARPGGPRRA